MNGHPVIFSALSDEDLMGKVVEGNSAAFTELYSRYSQPMLWYFHRMLAREDEKSQDFLQDLFLKVIEKPHLFDRSRRFSTWLYSVAHNMCKNEYRSQTVRSVIKNDGSADADNGDRPDHELHDKLFSEALYKELNLMDEDRKTAFLLKYKEGFSLKEISQVIGCNEGTVKSRLFYTSKKLSEKLQAFNPKNNR